MGVIIDSGIAYLSESFVNIYFNCVVNCILSRPNRERVGNNLDYCVDVIGIERVPRNLLPSSSEMTAVREIPRRISIVTLIKLNIECDPQIILGTSLKLGVHLNIQCVLFLRLVFHFRFNLE